MKKNDIILVAIVLLIALSSLFFIKIYRSDDGNYVVVKENKKIVLKANLDVDKEYNIKTEAGYNLIKVEGGSVRVIASDCKNKICVNHRKIDSTNESIICLPHKVIIEVQKKEDGEVDSE